MVIIEQGYFIRAILVFLRCIRSALECGSMEFSSSSSSRLSKVEVFADRREELDREKWNDEMREAKWIIILKSPRYFPVVKHGRFGRDGRIGSDGNLLVKIICNFGG
jgi:hypothetical protein